MEYIGWRCECLGLRHALAQSMQDAMRRKWYCVVQYYSGSRRVRRSYVIWQIKIKMTLDNHSNFSIQELRVFEVIRTTLILTYTI